MSPLEKFVAALAARDGHPRQVGGHWVASCPVPDHGAGRGDRRPSLSFRAAEDGRVLVRCFGSCTWPAIVAALGLRKRDIFPGAGDQPNGFRAPVAVARIRQRVPSDAVHLKLIDSRYCAALSARGRQHLARLLGLTANSLLALGVGWDAGRRAWSFPMRDGDGRVVGFRLRSLGGSKFTLAGTHEGLFLPADLPTGQRLVVTEGPTDAAALLGLGFVAVGRPSCTGGVAHTVRLVRRLRCPEVVLAADQDPAGQRGAANLAAALLLHAAVRVFTPPAKDVRAWVTGAGASAADVARLLEATPVQRLHVQVAGRSA